jgi:hypothetical protein
MKRVRGIIKGKKKNPPHLHKKIGTIHNGILESFTLCKTKKNKRNFIAYNNLTYAKKASQKKRTRSLPLLSTKRLSLCANYSNTSW